MEWRAALPPVDGWVRLDSVPGDVVLKLVRAGRDALRAVPAGAAAAAGESLLDHESLTVSGAGRTAVLPLRVLGSLTRMGFLGDARRAGRRLGRRRLDPARRRVRLGLPAHGAGLALGPLRPR